MDIDARLNELETRLAYQDRTIEQLDEVVLRLRADLERFERRFAELEEKLVGGGPEVGPANEPPPHW